MKSTSEQRTSSLRMNGALVQARIPGYLEA
jgi:hypothetical protein